MVDSIAFGDPFGLGTEADIGVGWRATAEPVERGLGTTVHAEDPGAFPAEFTDATTAGRADAKRTGFSFRARQADIFRFLRRVGCEHNGGLLS